MKSVTIHGKSVAEIVEIVHQMKAHGWIDKVDFDWEYHGPLALGTYDRYTLFNFYKEEYSTYFALRWL